MTGSNPKHLKLLENIKPNTIFFYSLMLVTDPGKGKVHPGIGHEGPENE